MEVLARAQRWEVVRVFEDVGISGKGFAERPGWDALMKFISKTQPAIDAVLVARVDRYARNVAEGLHVLDNELGPLHVRLRAADAPYIEPESLYGRITFTFALLMGEHERLLLVERTKAALAERRREGVHLGEFPKFFGRDDQGRLVPGETALAIVRGRTEGRTYADIARELGISRRQAWATAKFIAKKRAEWEDLNEEDT
jgi:DNA invertase Pin-like site-specific DNA recombinase